MILNNTQQNGFTVSVITDEEASVRNSVQFREELTALLDNGNKRILLSFEKVTYVDSSFLGSMVASLKYAISKGADIYLVNLRKDIYDLLELIRMNKVFKIFDTTEQAIENLQ